MKMGFRTSREDQEEQQKGQGDKPNYSADQAAITRVKESAKFLRGLVEFPCLSINVLFELMQ